MRLNEFIIGEGGVDFKKSLRVCIFNLESFCFEVVLRVKYFSYNSILFEDFLEDIIFR